MRRHFRFLIGAVVVVATGTGLNAVAQGPPNTYPSAIVAGPCEQRGDARIELNSLIVPTGNSTGAGETTIASSSYTVVGATLETLASTQLAIIIWDPTGDCVVACGEIGGPLDRNGALSIGLRPVESSGYSGIAYLAPIVSNPSQTGISVFLAETDSQASNGSSASAAEPDSGSGMAPPEPGTSNAADYATAVRRQVTILVGSLQRVNDLFGQPQPDNGEWSDQVLAELTLWQILYASAQDATPPSEFQNFNERYLQALSLLDGAARDIVTALETGDQGLLHSASQDIDQAIEEIRALDAADEEATPEAS
jgi:hypothetical protein